MHIACDMCVPLLTPLLLSLPLSLHIFSAPVSASCGSCSNGSNVANATIAQSDVLVGAARQCV